MIVSKVREQRLARGWSQERLARATGLSRPAVSAIETGRIVPSVAAAMALAGVFRCSVEELFAVREGEPRIAPEWAWPPERDPWPFWSASVGDRVLLYPVERTSAGLLPPDGTWSGGRIEWHGASDPRATLVIAGCDLAVGLLAAEVQQSASIRVLSFVRSSRRALELLGRDAVHLAGLHLQDARTPEGNRREVRARLGAGYTLLRVASWQEGVALQNGLGIASVRQAVGARVRWVGREEGSGARRCLDAIMGRRPRPQGCERVAFDHIGVVETIRTGWAQAGVCVQLAAEYGGLDFLRVRAEDYDLCCRTAMEDDPRVQAVVRVLRSRAHRRVLGELPGYDAADTGALLRVVSAP